MSTVRLKLPHKGLGEKGDVVSVPFGKGRELVKAGIAEYPAGTASPGAGQPAASPELAAALKKIGELANEVGALKAENSKLRAENAELKELLADEPEGGKSGQKPKK